MNKQNDVGGVDALRDMVRRLADCIANVSEIPAAPWGVQAFHLEQDARALLASPVAAPVVGWQPIETAPNNGDVLLYCCDTKEQLVGFSIGNGLFQFACHNGIEIVCRPDLWQPLPSPPAIASQEVGHG